VLHDYGDVGVLELGPEAELDRPGCRGEAVLEDAPGVRVEHERRRVEGGEGFGAVVVSDRMLSPFPIARERDQDTQDACIF